MNIIVNKSRNQKYTQSSKNFKTFKIWFLKLKTQTEPLNQFQNKNITDIF